MKSYLLITGDFVKTGGMDRANFALADYLARQRDSLHLVAYRVASELLAYPNVKFHQVPKLANSYLLGSPFLDWIGQSVARQLSPKCTSILVNGGNCQWGDVNWVHYVHAAYQSDSQVGPLRQFKTSFWRWLSLSGELKALKAAKVIIVNSDRTKQDLIKHLAIPQEKLHLVYYGIDPDSFYPATVHEKLELRQQLGWSADKPIVVFIGALGDRRKGFDTLFTAWLELSNLPNWDAELVVIGVGAELTKWQLRAKNIGISSIHFLGFRSDVPNLLRAADCLVAPTRYEAYGLGVHEALCCGLPAIVSSTAGVAERYPVQLQGLLLPDPDDAVDLVARLQKWWENKQHYSGLVSSLSQELREDTWDEMAKRIVNLMDG